MHLIAPIAEKAPANAFLEKPSAGLQPKHYQQLVSGQFY
jgi:hypothetical protein